MNQTHTYFGLLDDFAARHRDGNPVSSLAELNSHLLTAVIAGDPLLVNDGHLLMNPALTEAISQAKKSPFRALVDAEFVTVLSRNGGDIEHLADYMAKRKIATAMKLLKDRGYRDEYQPILAKWSRVLNSGQMTWYRPWPRYRTDDVYDKVADLVLQSMAIVLPADGDALKRFEGALDSGSHNRTAWEANATTLVAEGKLSDEMQHRLMVGANEAYQYAWGCILTDDHNPVSVQTRTPEYLGALDLRKGHPFEAAQEPIRVFLPNEMVALKGVEKRWELLADVVRAGSPSNRAKRAYRGMLARYYAGDGVSTPEMKDAAKQYSVALARQFGHPNRVDREMSLAFAAGNIGAATLLGAGLPGFVVGVALTAAEMAASHIPPVHQFVQRFGETKRKKWMRDVEPTGAATTVSSFQLDPDKVKPILADLPPYNPSDPV